MLRFKVYLMFIFSMLVLHSCGDAEEPEIPSQTDRQLTVADSINESSGVGGIVIGHIADACFGPSGEVLVLDQTAACVYSFGRDGDLETLFGGPGSGPGEMGNPMSIETAGDLIIVRDAVKHGYLMFDGSYDLLEEVSHWPTASPTDMVFSDDSSFIARTTSFESGDEGFLLRRTVSRYVIGEEQPSCTYFDELSPVDPSDFSDLMRMSTESLVFTADGAGRVYLSEVSGEEYLVNVFDSGGEVLYSISRDCEPVYKTESELEEEITLMETEARTMGVEGLESWEPDPLKPMITGLGVDGDMNLWVCRGTGTDQLFDIYGAGSQEEPAEAAYFPRMGNDWNFRVSASGILAWRTDPPSGMRTIYILE